jgi:hypothetical protein
MEAPAADGSLVEAAAKAARGGSRFLHFFWRRVTDARGCGRAFGHRHLPPRRRPRLAGACAAGSCAVARLVCSVGCGRTKRARAAAVVLPASALAFVAWGGGATEAAAAAEGGME